MRRAACSPSGSPRPTRPVNIEVSVGLRELLAAAGEGQLSLFRNDRTGKVYTENRLSKTFGWVRKAAVKAGGA